MSAESQPSIENRLERIKADLAVIKNAVIEHALWINWLKAMVSQRPESISQIPDRTEG